MIKQTMTKLTLQAATAAVGLLLAGAAQACPDWNLPAAESYSGTGDYFYQTRSYSVNAGGNYALAKCGHIRPATDVGPGFFPDRPDFRFSVSGMGPYTLHIRVVSQCDAALLINTASATWYYDDDANGNLDPLIVLTDPADGFIDIWVGTYDGSFCKAVLELETF
jgi:hypothetical protein